MKLPSFCGCCAPSVSSRCLTGSCQSRCPARSSGFGCRAGVARERLGPEKRGDGRPTTPWTWGTDEPADEAHERRRHRPPLGRSDRRGPARAPGQEAASSSTRHASRDPASSVSPLTMPLRTAAYVFPDLSERTFKGLPGLLADSLPDKYGSALFDTWLAPQGREPPERQARSSGSATRVREGSGALEFEPAIDRKSLSRRRTKISRSARLVELASGILTSATTSSPRWNPVTRKTDCWRSSASERRRVAPGQRRSSRGTLRPFKVRSGQVDAGPGIRTLAAQVRRRQETIANRGA